MTASMTPDLGRIKRNVAKMLDQGAPEEDVDSYIAGEGTTVDAVKAFQMPTTPGIIGQFGAGANKVIGSAL